MVKVWLYGYMMGVRSSRKLERALHEDIGFRVLSGNQQPDHWTLSDFRRRHHQARGRLGRPRGPVAQHGVHGAQLRQAKARPTGIPIPEGEVEGIDP
jgi:hypothetical protein